MTARSSRASDYYVEDDSSGDEVTPPIPQLPALEDAPVGAVDVPEASCPIEAGNFVVLDPGRLGTVVYEAAEVVRGRQFDDGVLSAYNTLKLKDNHTWKNKTTLVKLIGTLRSTLNQHFTKMQAAAT